MSQDLSTTNATSADETVYVAVAREAGTGRVVVALNAAAAQALLEIAESINADADEILDGSAGYAADIAGDVTTTASLLYGQLRKAVRGW